MNFSTFKTQLIAEFSRRFRHLSLAYEFRDISHTHCFFIGIDNMEEDESVLDFVGDYMSLYIKHIPDDDFVFLDKNSLLEPRNPEILQEAENLICVEKTGEIFKFLTNEEGNDFGEIGVTFHGYDTKSIECLAPLELDDVSVTSDLSFNKDSVEKCGNNNYAMAA